MKAPKCNIRLVGGLIILGMVAGILSVSPAVDSKEYLAAAKLNATQVTVASIFQFIMSLSYMGIAILLFPVIKRYGNSLAIGFLSFRIVAATLVIFGTILLLSILALSQESLESRNLAELEVIGNALKTVRDYVNHVFMIVTLCIANFMLYLLLIRSKLIPLWLSAWGLCGSMLSAAASVLILFQAIEIVTPEYLILNIPTAVQELILGIWLIVIGFNNKGSKNAAAAPVRRQGTSLRETADYH